MPDAFSPEARDESLLAEALKGLSGARKTLPPKFFYDAEGCRLFQAITGLPEYYLTRAERGLLESAAPDVSARMPTGALLVEYGASDEAKAELLLRARRKDEPVFGAYMPIDVAEAELGRLRQRLRKTYPNLTVHTVAADFLRPVALPPAFAEMARLGFFPGSTIGNLSPAEALRFLRQARVSLGSGALFWIGVDLRKDVDVLLAAYNDREGVTAAFNLNLLTRLNREAGADFNVSAFRHRAVWNDSCSRIEMHLESLRDQTVRIGGEAICFTRGETILTENSHKYTADGFRQLAERAGWEPREFWTDSQRTFSLHLLSAPSF